MIFEDLSWKSSDLEPFTAINIALIGFVIYWFINKSEKIKVNFYNKYNSDLASQKHILFTKYQGLLWMGIVPLIICLILIPNYSLVDYGLTIIPETSLKSVLWILGISCIVVPMNYFNSRKKKHLEVYPQIRAKKWTKTLMAKNALGWFVYLLGYEVLFRGILLIPVADHFGVWPAIAVNVALYSGTHIPKGLDETIGAIPLGIVLSLLTLNTGTIWIALFVHCALAWSNSFSSLKHHPEMEIIK